MKFAENPARKPASASYSLYVLHTFELFGGASCPCWAEYHAHAPAELFNHRRILDQIQRLFPFPLRSLSLLLGSIASKHFNEIMRSVISVTEFAGNPAWFLSAIFQIIGFPL